ncbi:MAG: single-stranded DNA-binding protein [Acidobacteriaceae bacterium]
MAKSHNYVALIGNTGKAPEIKYTSGGTMVANFSIATREKFKDKSGASQERTDWHNIVAYGKAAEIIEKYVGKGSKLHIEGRLQTSSWDDKDSGQKRYKTEIVVNDFILLSPPNGPTSNGNNGHQDESGDGAAEYQPSESGSSNIPF